MNYKGNILFLVDISMDENSISWEKIDKILLKY